MLAEDNFYGYTPAAQERCHRLFKGWAERGLDKDWFGFTSLNVTQDRQVLDYMARSGCLGFLMGIESLDYDALKQMHKSVNIGVAKKNNTSIKEAYRSSFQNVHDHGMIVWGSVIFGTDFDTPDTFKQIADAAWETDMDVCTFGIYTPMPDTELFGRLSREGRILRTSFPDDWYYYNSGHLVFQLKTLTLDQYIAGLTHVFESLYSPQALRERFKRTYAANGNTKSAMFAYRVGLDWRAVFQANLHELHALRDSGFYPHPIRHDRVAVPAALEPPAGGEGPGHARGPARLRGAIGGHDAVPGGSRDRAGAARFGGGLGRERLHRRHRRGLVTHSGRMCRRRGVVCWRATTRRGP